MVVVTWNVQWCRGIDGRVDPARTARAARDLADFDVLCLQEVAVNFPGLLGSRGEDQVAELSAALPGYIPIFGVATDLDDGRGGRRQFGNAIFSRLPVLQVFRHSLPWPADATVPSMQRLALEAVVAAKSGPVRVISTHLEYYSPAQRMAQAEALLRSHEEACAHARAPRAADDRPGGSFDVVPRPAPAIMCGDFNFKPKDLEHGLITAPLAAGVPRLVDAWSVTHPGEVHAPTVGVHEKSWPLYCCDFVFLTEDLVPRVRAMTVDAATDASDHQPVILELADR
jgi:endonuclease/exonuclease/phosphatase family metal-dependent hydrolase